MRELTDRNQDAAADPEVAWRGHAYFNEIRLTLPSQLDFGAGVRGSQRCWVAYAPSTDEFLAGYDLWLDVDESDDVDDDDLMAGGLVTIRLKFENNALIASPVRSERLPRSIYSGGTLDDIRARYPGLIEVDVD